MVGGSGTRVKGSEASPHTACYTDTPPNVILGINRNVRTTCGDGSRVAKVAYGWPEDSGLGIASVVSETQCSAMEGARAIGLINEITCPGGLSYWLLDEMQLSRDPWSMSAKHSTQSRHTQSERSRSKGVVRCGMTHGIEKFGISFRLVLRAHPQNSFT